jgi:hypothetical protein
VGTPSKRISPEGISSRTVIIFMVVDLQEPFGPEVAGHFAGAGAKRNSIHGEVADESFRDIA